jgi:hypothetical protein
LPVRNTSGASLDREAFGMQYCHLEFVLSEFENWSSRATAEQIPANIQRLQRWNAGAFFYALAMLKTGTTKGPFCHDMGNSNKYNPSVWIGRD